MKDDLPSVDALIALAKSNPAELERLRERYIEELITSAPASMQQRLRGLQFQIDSRRRLHSNPMGSCIMISKMMMDSLNRLNAALHGTLNGDREASKASVVPFRPAVNS